MKNDISIFTYGYLMADRAAADIYAAEFNLSYSLCLGQYVCVYQTELAPLIEWRVHERKFLIALNN